MSDISYRDDDEIMETFVMEMQRRLDEMEDGLSAVTPGAAPERETVDAMFRAAHSLKASANLLAFRNIESVTHHLESILDAMRSGRLVPARETVKAMRLGLDTLRWLVDDLETGDEADIGITLTSMERALGARPAAR